jgi:hypothetical protein
MNNKHAETEARELTLLALCEAYLAAGLSARHALLSAKADYACGLRIGSL